MRAVSGKYEACAAPRPARCKAASISAARCGKRLLSWLTGLAAGLAIGFGAQNLVRDVISGFFLILEDQVRVGDLARINGVAGTVEQVKLRTIVLRDGEGAVQVFPNGTITALANLSKQLETINALLDAINTPLPTQNAEQAPLQAAVG